jgi:hypothetical protein
MTKRNEIFLVNPELRSNVINVFTGNFSSNIDIRFYTRSFFVLGVL